MLNPYYGVTENGLPSFPLQRSTEIKQYIPEFDSSLENQYTQQELQLLAEALLLRDPKPPYEEPVWLNGSAYIDRLKHEIFTEGEPPDPAIISGMYWRTRPDGRKFYTEAERLEKPGRSFYR